MREEQMDAVFEAYHSAVHHLVTGPGGLKDRLRDALAELRKCAAFCVAWPAGGCEEQVAEDVPRLLGEGDWLDVMTDVELQDLAGDLRRMGGLGAESARPVASRPSRRICFGVRPRRLLHSS